MSTTSLFNRNFKKQIFIIICLLFFLLLAVYLKPQNKIDNVNVLNDAKQIDKSCWDALKDNSHWFLCYRQEFQVLIKQYSLAYVLQVLNALQQINPKTKECHLIAHQIAQSEVEKDPNNWQELVGIVSKNYCDYGFLHGALEGRMRFDPNFSLNEKTIGEICTFVEQKNKLPDAYALCIHGMGHILLAEQNGDIPSAIAICRKSPPRGQFNCFAGVFMEDFTRFNLITHTGVKPVVWDEEEATFLENRCRTYNELEAKACWMEMAHLYVEFTPDNPSRVFERCSSAPTIEDRNTCYNHAVGKLFVINNTADNTFLSSVCKPYETDNESHRICVNAGVSALMNNTLDSVQRTISYCKSIPMEFYDTCYNTIGTYLKVLVSRPEQEKLCQGVPEGYQKLCTNRNQAENSLIRDGLLLWNEGVSAIATSIWLK